MQHRQRPGMNKSAVIQNIPRISWFCEKQQKPTLLIYQAETKKVLCQFSCLSSTVKLFQS